MRNKRRAAARRRWLSNLAAGVVGLGLALVLAEGAARIAYPRWTEFNNLRFMDFTTVEGAPLAIGRPGFDGWFAQNNGDFRIPIRVNAFGLRNDEPVEAADGKLWALGDSFTFGWGVLHDEIFGAVAAARLGWNWYDVASPGADIEDYRHLLLRMPPSVHPRAVVLGLTIENDLRIYPAEGEAVAAPVGPAPSESSLLRQHWMATKHGLTEHSAFYNLMAQALKRIDSVNSLLVGLRLLEPANHGHHQFEESQLDAVLESSTAEIVRLRALVPPEVPFVVLLIPAREDLLDGDPFYRRQRLGMAERLTARGITVVDPFDAFAPEGVTRVHFAHDGHWSPLGHRLAGEAVARALAPSQP